LNTPDTEWQGSGRKPGDTYKFALDDLEILRSIAVADPWADVESIRSAFYTQTGKDISNAHVKRVRRQQTCRVTIKDRPVLVASQQLRRVEFVERAHAVGYQNICFSDEKWFHLYNKAGKRSVFFSFPPSTAPTIAHTFRYIYVKTADDVLQFIGSKKDRLKVMFWGVISYSIGAGPLLRLRHGDDTTYIETLVNGGYPAWAVTAQVNGRQVLQYDLASCHKTNFSLTSLASFALPPFEGVVKSPELSPIEYLWSDLSRHVAKRGQPSNEPELVAVVHKAWQEVATIEKIRFYYNHCVNIACKVHANKGSNLFNYH